MKPVFSNKLVSREKITLVENEKIITDNKDIAKVLNDFFSNIIKTTHVPQTNHSDSSFENARHPTLKAKVTYHNHHSILALTYHNYHSTLAIKEKIKSVSVFTFNRTTNKDVMKEIKDLDVCKASQKSDISTMISNADIFSSFIYQSFDNMTDVCIFPASLKLANITPVFKKRARNSKQNYRPVLSILPNISKIYERCLFKQIPKYFEIIFSKFQCGFR